MKITAIVPAAGTGWRITKKKGRRKPFFIVMGKPILIHTLLALESSNYITDIIVVVHKEDIKKWKAIVNRFRLKTIRSIIPGGKTRFESVKKGLSFVSEDSDIVFIHDGVRPLIDKKIIWDTIKACKRFGAVVAGVPMVSTVKSIREDLSVRTTPDRKRFYMAQTPQVFKRDIILKAYNTKYKPSITDDSMLVERLGYKVKLVPSSYQNIKVTTPEDLILAEALLRIR